MKFKALMMVAGLLSSSSAFSQEIVNFNCQLSDSDGKVISQVEGNPTRTRGAIIEIGNRSYVFMVMNIFGQELDVRLLETHSGERLLSLNVPLNNFDLSKNPLELSAKNESLGVSVKCTRSDINY